MRGRCRRWLVVIGLALPAGCAPVLDWGALTGADGGMDGSSDAAVDGGPGSSDGPIEGAEDADAPANPCAKVPAKNFGYYCGLSRQNNFTGGDPDTLYDCIEGSTASTQTCTTDCVVSQAGLPDTCDNCGAYADGTYCGWKLGYSGDFALLANVIFTCKNMRYTGTENPCTAPKATCAQDGGVAYCTDGG
jgi:hypothetical protein